MRQLLIILLLLGTASVSPVIFPIAESGRGSMDVLAMYALLPSIVFTVLFIGLLRGFDRSLAKLALVGISAGAIATIGLEAVRLTGFWLGFMPVIFLG